MADLFEYKFESLPTNFPLQDFKQFLDNVWQKYRETKNIFWRENLYETETDEDIKKKQPFLFFDDGKVKSRNYVGYIKFKNYEFNLYPKICSSCTDTKQINNMLLLWLQYSNNVILPKIDTHLMPEENCDFIEILIYLFARYTSDLLSVSIYQHYEEISEETNFLKGKLNFNEYIKNCACGKSHKFHCTYDSFEMNNKFNQIVKYVAKCLFNITKNYDNKISDTQNYLTDIIHTLDEVDDVICTYTDCESVYINRFMSDFNTVLDYCKLFLANSITFNECGEFDNFAFLMRTEVLFEDFVSNFAKEKFPQLNIIAQSQKKLDENGKFSYKPDLIIQNGEKIIDIKYKNISTYYNVSQADVYQCMAYAVKNNCKDVILLYPKFDDKDKNLPAINIKTSEIYGSEAIKISFKFIDCCNSEEKITKNLSDILFSPPKQDV